MLEHQHATVFDESEDNQEEDWRNERKLDSRNSPSRPAVLVHHFTRSHSVHIPFGSLAISAETHGFASRPHGRFAVISESRVGVRSIGFVI
jgi:hypothetical protein